MGEVWGGSLGNKRTFKVPPCFWNASHLDPPVTTGKKGQPVSIVRSLRSQGVLSCVWRKERVSSKSTRLSRPRDRGAGEFGRGGGEGRGQGCRGSSDFRKEGPGFFRAGLLVSHTGMVSAVPTSPPSLPIIDD